MKKLIPVVAAVSFLALVGCTTPTETATTTTTRTSTTTNQRNASVDPTLDNTRSTNTMNLGPR